MIINVKYAETLTTLVLYQKQLFRQSTDGHMITEQNNKIKNK